jgi:nucleotide-binding universal stress UspA family protein
MVICDGDLNSHQAFKRVLMGSVSESVLHHAHTSVLVARGEPISFPTKILAATDGSKEAALAASTAANIARRTGSELHVVHVGKVAPDYHPERHGYLARYDKVQEAAQRSLDEQVERIKAAAGTVAQAHLRMGLPDKEIVVLSEEIGAGLIVAGSRGLGPLKRVLLGSVSSSVARHAYRSVLVVREGD